MIGADELIGRIANNWKEIAAELGCDRESFESELTRLLRRLDATRGPTEDVTIKLILELFARFTSGHGRLIEMLGGIAKGAGRPAGSAKMARYTTVPVYYGTDREVRDGVDGVTSYGPGRGQLAVGYAEVTIPDDHRMGEIEKPRLWKLEFREDPEKHITVLFDPGARRPKSEFE
jgi:hypothetical protein